MMQLEKYQGVEMHLAASQDNLASPHVTKHYVHVVEGRQLKNVSIVHHSLPNGIKLDLSKFVAFEDYYFSASQIMQFFFGTFLWKKTLWARRNAG